MNHNDFEFVDLRRLAAAVIERALTDALANPDQSDGRNVRRFRREQARAFLLHDDALNLWCDIAGVNVTALRDRLRAGLLDGRRMPSKRLRFVMPTPVGELQQVNLRELEMGSR